MPSNATEQTQTPRILKINEAIQNLLPPLTEEEFAGLEADILKHGVISRIHVWDDIILDGHARYKICHKHGIPFETRSWQFNSLEEALIWVWKTHHYQRHMTPEQDVDIAKQFVQKTMAKRTKRVAVNKITVSETRRKIEPDKVRELAESIQQVGLLNPITVTRNFHLVAGAHRLEACKQLGWDEITCNLLEGEPLHLELAEIDENLIRNELDVISVGELALRRDEILEALGLRASSGDNRFSKNRGAPGAPLPKTTESIANEIGVSKRALQENKQLARNLVPEAKEVIRKEDITKKEALKLARMEPERQKVVVNRIQSGEAKSVQEAEQLDVREINPEVTPLEVTTALYPLPSDEFLRHGEGDQKVPSGGTEYLEKTTIPSMDYLYQTKGKDGMVDYLNSLIQRYELGQELKKELNKS